MVWKVHCNFIFDVCCCCLKKINNFNGIHYIKIVNYYQLNVDRLLNILRNYFYKNKLIIF